MLAYIALKHRREVFSYQMVATSLSVSDLCSEIEALFTLTLPV